MAKLSPMMNQYMQIKENHKKHLLFFRLGDFYELFFDDAILASKELELTLTGRDCGLKERAPMCGIPYHSVDTYIKKLVEKGHKVAICEQLENPATAKGLVSRDVVRVITPGTISESGMLDDARNNYICSINRRDHSFGICFADISTGDVYATEIESENLVLDIINEFERFSPSEILYNMEFVDLTEIAKYMSQQMRCTGELVDEKEYDLERARELALEQFGDHFIESDLPKAPLALASLGVLLQYLRQTQKESVCRIVHLHYYNEHQFMDMDVSARRNLELFHTISGEKKGSLIDVLDRTKTAMGKRLMRKTIEQPLIQVSQISLRQNAVAALLEQTVRRNELNEVLSNIHDMERLMTKVIYGSINPRELKSLSYTMGFLPRIKKLLTSFEDPLLKKINQRISGMEELHDLIESAICSKPPVTLKDGKAIRDGFHDELDELRHIGENSREYISQIEQQQRERTGIKNLKIGFNRVFGYYIEVTKSNLSQVPEDYIRKQTLVGAERYITQELKEYEQKVLTSNERSILLEQEIFAHLRKHVAEQLIPMQNTAESVAVLDILCSFAQIAQERRYVCPQITTDGEIVIKDGRHPVVEAFIDRPFVPNDTQLNQAANKMMIITGPNMAGKSTYMRQVALIVIMAQIGCFVPASFAKISLVDKIFTRIGASDNLAAGRSTFMIEMSEVAGILKNATTKSLVVLDEIGRGTSTFDGMSIAKAVAEYIIRKETLGCKTMFATHYHELTSLEQQLPGVANYNIAVKKRGDDITFLRKIVPGGVDDSYGVAVAKLAGLPEEVICRANEILQELESGASEIKPHAQQEAVTDMPIQVQMEESKEYKAIQKIKDISPDTLTPIEAMNTLFELRKMVE